MAVTRRSPLGVDARDLLIEAEAEAGEVMPKELPAAQRDILHLANELGYFPLESHLRE